MTSISRSYVTHPREVIEDALTRVTNAMFNLDGVRPIARIPADPKGDTDLVLGDAVTELFDLRERLTDLEQKAFALGERVLGLETRAALKGKKAP